MDRSRINILLADSQSLARRILERQLRELGFARIETAADAAGAQSRLASGGVDIVIAEEPLLQPGQYGNAAVVLLTPPAQTPGAAPDSALRLAKPVPPEALAAAMKTALAQLAAMRGGPAPVRLLDDVLHRTGDELAGAISDSVLKTVEALFGLRLHPSIRNGAGGAARHGAGRDKDGAKTAPASFVVHVTLSQGEAQARLRLIFDRHLLETLVSDFYPREALRRDAVLEDAAAEIANVICNKIKAFVNRRGFGLEMGFPEARAVSSGEKPGDKDGPVSLAFTLVGDTLAVSDDLRVDMS
jgi:hypothetical protein